MSNKFKAAVLFILTLVILSGCKSGGGGSYVKKDKIEGYKGEAKLNPYLVAERFLEQESYNKTSVRTGFVKYESRLGMVISPATTLNAAVVTDKMLDWVAKGGVYVCLLERGEKNYTDIGERCEHETVYWIDVETPELDYLLDKMQIDLVDDSTGETTGGENYRGEPKSPVVLGKELPLTLDVKVKLSGESYNMKLGGTKAMKLNRRLSYDDYYDEAAKDGSHRFLGLRYGSGRIYFISDARAFRNPYLGMADHASVLETMANDSYGDIVFSFNKRRGFWALMGNYALPALIGIFLLLVFWLWKNMPRFGPLLEVSEGHDRDYLESVRNSGHFLWSHHRYDSLLQPLRKEIYKRSGMFNEHGEASASLVENLSESSGIPADEVLEALSRDKNIDGQTMVKMTKNLQTILKSL